MAEQRRLEQELRGRDEDESAAQDGAVAVDGRSGQRRVAAGGDDQQRQPGRGQSEHRGGQEEAAGSDPALAGAAIDRYGALLCRGLIFVSAAKLLFEASLFRHLASRSTTSLKRTAWLMTGALSNVTMARFAAGLLGGLAMPGLLLLSRVPAPPGQGQDLVFAVLVGMLFVACLAGELLERYLFFAAVASPRMPGTL